MNLKCCQLPPQSWTLVIDRLKMSYLTLDDLCDSSKNSTHFLVAVKWRVPQFPDSVKRGQSSCCSTCDGPRGQSCREILKCRELISSTYSDDHWHTKQYNMVITYNTLNQNGAECVKSNDFTSSLPSTNLKYESLHHRSSSCQYSHQDSSAPHPGPHPQALLQFSGAWIAQQMLLQVGASLHEDCWHKPRRASIAHLSALSCLQ